MKRIRTNAAYWYRVHVGLWLVLGSLLLVPTGNAYAHPRMGVQAGLNFSHFRFPDKDNLPLDPGSYKSRLGLRIGVIAQVHAQQAISLQTGLVLDIKGDKVEYRSRLYYPGGPLDGIPAQAKTLSNLYYLNVPLLVTFKAQTGGLRPFALIGPECSFLVKATDSTTSRGGGRSSSGSMSTTDLYPRLEVGLSAGFGMEFQVHHHPSMIDARYTWGLRNLNDTGNRNEHHIYNRAATLSYGIFF